MRHLCEQKKRAQLMASPTGQAAFGYYTTWMRLKKFKAQSRDAFMASRYYRSFISFTEMVVSAGILNPEQYIQLMIEHNNITPDLWCRPQCYRIYLDWVDHQQNPMQQVQQSIEVLIGIAEKEGVDYRGIIAHLGSQKILGLIHQRKLSPWFLFHSAKVAELVRSLTKEEQNVYNNAINIAVWVDKLKENQKLREEIKGIIKEIEL